LVIGAGADDAAILWIASKMFTARRLWTTSTGGSVKPAATAKPIVPGWALKRALRAQGDHHSQASDNQLGDQRASAV